MLTLVTAGAVSVALRLVGSGTAEAQRSAVLESAPEIIALFSDGSAAIAADFYEDEREAAGAPERFSPDLVIVDRAEKVGRALAWATEPLFGDEPLATVTRLQEVVQQEVARPFRDTVTTNSRRDPASVGWRRVAAGGCKFCRMLADRGAVYRAETARFASHPSCGCSAAPVFVGQDAPEADVIQYVASQRQRSAAQQQRLRDHLAAMPD